MENNEKYCTKPENNRKNNDQIKNKNAKFKKIVHISKINLKILTSDAKMKVHEGNIRENHKKT